MIDREQAVEDSLSPQVGFHRFIRMGLAFCKKVREQHVLTGVTEGILQPAKFSRNRPDIIGNLHPRFSQDTEPTGRNLLRLIV